MELLTYVVLIGLIVIDGCQQKATNQRLDKIEQRQDRDSIEWKKGHPVLDDTSSHVGDIKYHDSVDTHGERLNRDTSAGCVVMVPGCTIIGYDPDVTYDNLDNKIEKKTGYYKHQRITIHPKHISQIRIGDATYIVHRRHHHTWLTRVKVRKVVGMIGTND
jgi:hypothetical protein